MKVFGKLVFEIEYTNNIMRLVFGKVFKYQKFK